MIDPGIDDRFIIIALKEVLSENVVCIRLSLVRIQWTAV
jgi:hypothetical protein